MGRYLAVFSILSFSAFVGGCTHAPETVVHLSAPNNGAWSVRNHEGARICSLPCRVELEANHAVVVSREGGGLGQEFVVHQESLGAGFWSGVVRNRQEPSPGALAIHAFSSTLVTAGSSMVETSQSQSQQSPHSRHRDDDRMAAGIVLSGLGTVGMLASSAWPGKTRQELVLERMATP